MAPASLPRAPTILHTSGRPRSTRRRPPCGPRWLRVVHSCSVVAFMCVADVDERGAGWPVCPMTTGILITEYAITSRWTGTASLCMKICVDVDGPLPDLGTRDNRPAYAHEKRFASTTSVRNLATREALGEIPSRYAATGGAGMLSGGPGQHRAGSGSDLQPTSTRPPRSTTTRVSTRADVAS